MGAVSLVDEYNIPQKETDLAISTAPFSWDGLLQAKKLTKENKACRDDGIPPEVAKRYKVSTTLH